MGGGGQEHHIRRAAVHRQSRRDGPRKIAGELFGETGD
jgi:hypothetical protein